jgi:hypothetical protein
MMEAQTAMEELIAQLSPQERIELAAADSLFYSRHFFPRTFRQVSPEIHAQVWWLLDCPEYEHVGLEMFRGSGKTTLARTNVTKRVAYGISRTILFISASQDHAMRSVRWVKKQVESNHYWRQTYGLRKGSKWSDSEIEIINETLGISIFVLAVGITGQTRGINIDDYRPDFIIVDDPCDEENTGTEEQRRKTSELFFGAVQPGLAPRSEMEWAKMALLQTGLHKKDLINGTHSAPDWHTVKFPILWYDHEGAPHSAWPERWSTEVLLAKKRNYFEKGQGHVWMREYECEIQAPEEAPLKLEWLRYWEHLPERMLVYCGIDPAREKSTNPHKTCIVFIGVDGPDVYLLDYFEQTGLNPDEIWNFFYAGAMKWRPRTTGVETIAFQQSLKWYMEKKMKERGTYFQIMSIEDYKRKKPDRILQEVGDTAFRGNLLVHAERHAQWVDYYRDWRYGIDIDLLDATALALMAANPVLIMSRDGDGYYPLLDESSIPDLQYSEEYFCP